jgi:hypothetical protein
MLKMKSRTSNQSPNPECLVASAFSTIRVLLAATVSSIVLTLSVAIRVAPAQGAPPNAAPGVPPSSVELTNSPIKDLGNGRFQLGKVILDKKARTVTIPTVVNMNSGLVEYFLVSNTGKLHESILRTEAEPYHIHVAMLLLGAKGATAADPADFYDPRKPIPGDKVSLEATWQAGEKKMRTTADELVNNTQSKQTMSKGPWIFNGSQVIDGSFVAQREGSIISIMADPYALINNPRKGREDDEIWFASTNALPPLSAPVDVIVRLQQ